MIGPQCLLSSENSVDRIDVEHDSGLLLNVSLGYKEEDDRENFSRSVSLLNSDASAPGSLFRI